jgi:hypothetical protein
MTRAYRVFRYAGGRASRSGLPITRAGSCHGPRCVRSPRQLPDGTPRCCGSRWAGSARTTETTWSHRTARDASAYFPCYSHTFGPLPFGYDSLRVLLNART